MNSITEATIGFVMLMTLIGVLLVFKTELIQVIGDKWIVIGILMFVIMIGGIFMLHVIRDEKPTNEKVIQ